ncbi:MAG: hypothetical protein PVF65_03710 [Sphingomonadales bacterium]|jgi:hypothetical protein
MLQIFGFLIFAVMATLVLRGLSDACADILLWAQGREPAHRSTDHRDIHTPTAIHAR